MQIISLIFNNNDEVFYSAKGLKKTLYLFQRNKKIVQAQNNAVTNDQSLKFKPHNYNLYIYIYIYKKLKQFKTSFPAITKCYSQNFWVLNTTIFTQVSHSFHKTLHFTSSAPDPTMHCIISDRVHTELHILLYYLLTVSSLCQHLHITLFPHYERVVTVSDRRKNSSGILSGMWLSSNEM